MPRTKSQNVLLIGGGIFLFLLIVGIIIGIIMYNRNKSISSTTTGPPSTTGPPTTTGPPSTTRPPSTTTRPPTGTTLPPTQAPMGTPTGGVCTQLNACISGNFCNGNGICQTGIGISSGRQ